MLRIGLTGGIGSGKTTVGNLFAARGAPVLDADDIAHRLSEPGQAGYQAIVSHFGEAVLDAEGAIDRAKLRTTVFERPEQRRLLENLLHPLVFDAMRRSVAELRSAYCILSIPLLVETDCRSLLDRILVVDAPPALQIERVRQRNGWDSTQIERVLAAQCSREARLAAADDVIDNQQSLDALERQVDALHRRYLRLAGQSGA